jgi:glycosyltransferase involved in cell wall biosynthesis
MKILQVNKFFYPKGGCEVVLFDTARLLERKGHQVVFFSMHHPRNMPSPDQAFFVSRVDFDAVSSFPAQVRTALRIIYSFEAKRKITALIEKHRPDIVHLHNFHHQISPSVLDVFRRFRLPAVMTLHDYKVVCPTYLLFLGQGPCEACRGGRFYQCFLRRCTKGSVLGSAVNTLEMYVHRYLLRVNRRIDCFISPSRFLMDKCREMGFEGKTVCLPHFLDLKDYDPSFGFEEKALVYFGRLSHEKGLHTLLKAVRNVPIRLNIIGDGPARKELEQKAQREEFKHVRFLGYMTGPALKDEIKKAMAVVLPSEWYENFPRTILEAYGLGKPVIGARIGGITELIKDGETGMTFTSGDAEGLERKIRLLAGDPGKAEEMGVKARRYVENEFNPERFYQGLIEVYERVRDKYR